MHVSINWDACKEVGLAAETEVPDYLRAQRDQHLESAIRTSEGIDAFARLMRRPLPQWLVVTQSPDVLLSTTQERDAGEEVVRRRSFVTQAGVGHRLRCAANRRRGKACRDLGGTSRRRGHRDTRQLLRPRWRFSPDHEVAHDDAHQSSRRVGGSLAQVAFRTLHHREGSNADSRSAGGPAVFGADHGAALDIHSDRRGGDLMSPHGAYEHTTACHEYPSTSSSPVISTRQSRVQPGSKPGRGACCKSVVTRSLAQVGKPEVRTGTEH